MSKNYAAQYSKSWPLNRLVLGGLRWSIEWAIAPNSAQIFGF